MSFPDLSTFPKASPGPYECGMGKRIVALLDLFAGHVFDDESHAAVSELAAAPDRWSAAHAVFDVIRPLRRKAGKAEQWHITAQYTFEELCCEAMYNATHPRDPFDSSAPFYVAPFAIRFARVVDVPLETLADVLTEQL